MTSLSRHTWDVGTYFGMYGNRRSLAILWYQLDVSGVSFSSTQGGGTNVLQKRLDKTRVKHISKICEKIWKKFKNVYGQVLFESTLKRSTQQSFKVVLLEEMLLCAYQANNERAASCL